jgi:hypothetical protein
MDVLLVIVREIVLVGLDGCRVIIDVTFFDYKLRLWEEVRKMLPLEPLM